MESPESPLLRFHDPGPEEQIRDGMGQYAGGKAPRSIGDATIKYAGQQRGRPIRIRLSLAKRDCRSSLARRFSASKARKTANGSV